MQKIYINKLKNILQKYVSNFLIQNNYPGLSLNVDIPNFGSFNLSVGLSDIENKIEMNTSNHFRIASISKTFTAAAIL